MVLGLILSASPILAEPMAGATRVPASGQRTGRNWTRTALGIGALTAGIGLGVLSTTREQQCSIADGPPGFDGSTHCFNVVNKPLLAAGVGLAVGGVALTVLARGRTDVSVTTKGLVMRVRF